MIALRRTEQRHHYRHHDRDSWLTFGLSDPAAPLANGFGTLEILEEIRLPPGASVPRHPHRNAEIVTYVRAGTLGHEDTLGRTGVIHPGEFHRRTVGRGIRYSATNASRSDWAHVFQIWICPSQAELEPSQEQKRFSVAERRRGLCVTASPDARRESLRIHQDALLYSALLDPGQHVVHELAQGRSAWLHLIEGEVTLGDVVLTTGDGVGFSAERAVSFTARKESEILLIDLGVKVERVLP